MTDKWNHIIIREYTDGEIDTDYTRTVGPAGCTTAKALANFDMTGIDRVTILDRETLAVVGQRTIDGGVDRDAALEHVFGAGNVHYIN